MVAFCSLACWSIAKPLCLVYWKLFPPSCPSFGKYQVDKYCTVCVSVTMYQSYSAIGCGCWQDYHWYLLLPWWSLPHSTILKALAHPLLMSLIPATKVTQQASSMKQLSLFYLLHSCNAVRFQHVEICDWLFLSHSSWAGYPSLSFQFNWNE